jgi:hypothetical protein
MANEFKHSDVGDDLSKAEWMAEASHIADGQAAGDLLYFDGTYWKRLPKGTQYHFLKMGATLPAWANLVSEQGDILYGDATPAIAALAHGVAGQILTTGGHGANPSWTGSIVKSKRLTISETINSSKQVAYTGVGFKPSCLIAVGKGARSWTLGLVADNRDMLGLTADGGLSVVSTSWFLAAYITTTVQWYGALTSFDADGFTVDYTYSGGGTDTYTAYVLCIR